MFIKPCRTTLLAICTLVVCCGIADLATAQPEQNEIVNQVERLYYQGQFEEAELLALRALTNTEQLSPMEQARLHRTLGFIYVVLEERDKATQQFINWLQIDPGADLDPLYISPKIIQEFEAAKIKYEEMVKAGPPPDFTALENQRVAVQRSLFFPGLGQIYREQYVKGYTLVVSEIALLGILAYCQFNIDDAQNDYLNERDPAFFQEKYDKYNNLYRGRYASLALAAGVYLYSLFDAIYLPPATDQSTTSLSLGFGPEATPQITLTVNLSNLLK
ncbi:hypothetical protein KKA00_03865 [bacterium]|nr:hypothetical protein [bacterium]MBU1651330.1 hypothetical protein [bacterium]MBU1881957.1 hypothetical protein [bacterium]